MNKINLDVNVINKIIKNIIRAISASRDQILNIVDNIRQEKENSKSEIKKS